MDFRSAAQFFLVLTTLAVPSVALACFGADPASRAIPGANDVAPVNARVRVFVGTDAAGAEKEDVLLVRTDVKPERPVATRRADLAMGSVRVIELTPTSPLDANAAFEVRHRIGMKRGLSSGFTTSTVTDTTAPSWLGVIATPTWERIPRESPAMRSPTSPWIEVDPLNVREDLTSEANLVIGIWRADAKGVIAFASPPALILPMRSVGEKIIGVPVGRAPRGPWPFTWSPSTDVHWLGAPLYPADNVDMVNYVPAPFWRGPAQPATRSSGESLGRALLLGTNDTCGGYISTFDVDARAPVQKLGFRVIDLAGNMSAPAEATVDLRQSKESWRSISGSPW